MRRLLVVLLLVCGATRLEAAHIHTENASDGPSASTTTTIASYTASAGNLITCATMTFGSGGAPDVSGIARGGQSFTLGRREDASDTGTQLVEIWYLANASSTTNNIVATWASTPSYRLLICSEFSGVATSSPLDGAGGGTSSSGTTANVTYSATGSSLFYGAVAAGSSGSFSANNSWTIPTNGSDASNMPGAVAYLDSPGSASQEVSFNIDSSSWGVVGVAFVDAGGGGGGACGQRALTGVGC